jgi:hypothetical protein
MTRCRWVLAAVVVATRFVRPRVGLTTDTIEVPGAPAAVAAHLRERFAEGPDVLAADRNAAVRRFAGRAGIFPYRTVELVTFAADAITFEHLRGPFASCHEVFELRPAPGGTRVAHRGTFVLRGGLLPWAVLAIPVKRAFGAHVHEHLRRLRSELDREAAVGP